MCGSRNSTEDPTIFELNKYQIKYEVRHLKVGDFTWICREKDTKEELVLPYIAERKRMDDLGHSIKDGRFHEQKFRLKQCGVQNLIYIVENYGNNTRTCLPLSSLLQGATNTLIQDQFQVKFTEHHQHSMQYLSGITMMLSHVYEVFIFRLRGFLLNVCLKCIAAKNAYVLRERKFGEHECNG